MMKTILLALACGSVLTAAAPAQTPPMGPPPAMNPMAADANHDGIVTRDEYLADAEQRFAQMDADHDGRVTRKEREAYRDAMRDRRIADGAAPPPPPPGGQGPEGRRPDDRGPGGPGGGDMTRADYMARAAERFDRMDANRDGRLDATEIAALRERRHERRGGDTPPPPPPPADPR
jgi:hypothetical protein